MFEFMINLIKMLNTSVKNNCVPLESPIFMAKLWAHFSQNAYNLWANFLLKNQFEHFCCCQNLTRNSGNWPSSQIWHWMTKWLYVTASRHLTVLEQKLKFGIWASLAWLLILWKIAFKNTFWWALFLHDKMAQFW